MTNRLDSKLEDELLRYVERLPDGIKPDELRRIFVLRGYKEGDLRTAIFNLWENGHVNVTPDRKVKAVIIVEDLSIRELILRLEDYCRENELTIRQALEAIDRG